MTNDEIAMILDATADYVDGIESTKVAAEKTAREKRVGVLAERYEASAGESIPSSMKEKLATLDVDTLDQLLKVAHNSSDSPASLGGPADLDDVVAPRTIKEAAVQADDHFLSWIIND